MKLELRDDNDKFVKELTDESKTLEELGVKNGYHVHASDPNAKAGLFDDIPNEETEGFKLTDEEYAQRRGNFSKFYIFRKLRHGFGMEKTE